MTRFTAKQYLELERIDILREKVEVFKKECQ
jgi:hypothetical protein